MSKSSTTTRAIATPNRVTAHPGEVLNEEFLKPLAMSVNAFPSVIAEMARGSYPLDGWVQTIPFDGVIDRGIERLRQHEGMKILVDVAGAAARRH